MNEMKYSFDLHTHSCLSPCGSDENTPSVIAGLAALNGQNIIALTDHNSCKNCEVFVNAAGHYGVLGICGMELTTAEEVHVVCLFPDVHSAMAFDEYVYSRMPRLLNKPEFFGRQYITDIDDNVVSEEELLLAGASSIEIYEVSGLVKEFDGICYPAHIDRDSYSLISNLGFWDPVMDFNLAELSYSADEKIWSERKDLNGVPLIKGSDAHYPGQLKEPFQYMNLSVLTAGNVIKELKNIVTVNRR